MMLTTDLKLDLDPVLKENSLHPLWHHKPPRTFFTRSELDLNLIDDTSYLQRIMREKGELAQENREIRVRITEMEKREREFGPEAQQAIEGLLDRPSSDAPFPRKYGATQVTW
jgi:hypothetical protein